jgi:hypothetical protein
VFVLPQPEQFTPCRWMRVSADATFAIFWPEA